MGDQKSDWMSLHPIRLSSYYNYLTFVYFDIRYDLPPCKTRGRGRTLVMRRISSPDPFLAFSIKIAQNAHFLAIFGVFLGVMKGTPPENG
jgi:hypothetical protein